MYDYVADGHMSRCVCGFREFVTGFEVVSSNQSIKLYSPLVEHTSSPVHMCAYTKYMPTCLGRPRVFNQIALIVLNLAWIIPGIIKVILTHITHVDMCCAPVSRKYDIKSIHLEIQNKKYLQ